MKQVPRSNLLFSTEDADKFLVRFTQAKEIRYAMLYLQHYKDYLRDIIPKGGNVFCSSEILRSIISKGLAANKELEESENERALDLLDEIL